MASHTNVSIPDQHSFSQKLLEENEILKFKLARSEKAYDWLLGEFENIPKAVRQWGYVTLKNDSDGHSITLVEKKEDANKT